MNVLITGGTGVIGGHLVRMMAKEHDVCFTYLNNAHLAVYLCNETGASCYQLDVSEEPSSDYMIGLRDLVCKDGSLDILINCAGINIPNDFGSIEYDDWTRVIDVNLNGVYNVTKLFENYISYGGRIINIGSVSADIGGKVSSHYAASKLGLVGLTRNLALYFAGRRITCNTVSPGYVESEMADSAMNEVVAKTIESIPLGRMCKLDDIYSAVSFIAGDGASYITGQDIKVNGGLSW